MRSLALDLGPAPNTDGIDERRCCVLSVFAVADGALLKPLIEFFIGDPYLDRAFELPRRIQRNTAVPRAVAQPAP